MNTKLLYSLFILVFFSCKPKAITYEKNHKIVVHAFTGNGDHDEIINWFFIKNVSDNGPGGFYFESASEVDDFKQARFVYSKIRPIKLEGQYAIEERILLLNPDDLPGDIIQQLPALESVYQ